MGTYTSTKYKDDSGNIQFSVEDTRTLEETKINRVRIIKIKAGEQIDELYPLWKQVNQLRRSVDLQQNKARTTEEEEELTAILAWFQELDDIRTSSDQAEETTEAATNNEDVDKVNF